MKPGMSIADFVGLMDRAGVEVGVLRAGNAIIADVLAEYPDRFIGLATISPHDGMRGVRELVRLVQDLGFGAMRVSALYSMIPASDRRYYPLYAKCVELDIPVHLLQHELCYRSALRSRPSTPPRPGRRGFSGAANCRGVEWLAMGP